MGLRDDILHEPVSSMSLRPLVQVDEDATVGQAIAEMRQEKLGCVMVLDKAGKPIGQFNERLLMPFLLQHPDGTDDPVTRHMSRKVICVCQDEPIVKMIGQMETHRPRWVCVVDETGRAIALSGQRGVIEYIVNHFPRQILVQPIEKKLAIDQREGA